MLRYVMIGLRLISTEGGLWMIKRKTFPLKGKKILITGVSRRAGIGYAIARQVATFGASVIIQHYKPHDQEQEWGGDDLSLVFKGIKEELVDNATFHEYQADFLDPLSPDRLFNKIAEECGPVDGLVCNHSLSGSDGPLGELTAEMIDKHYTINPRATLLLA